MKSSFWLVIPKCLIEFFASVLVGGISAAAMVFLAGIVNDWDDAPGGGFLALGAIGFGILAGIVAGACLAGGTWRGRPAAESKTSFTAAQLYLLSSTLLIGALLSAWTAIGSAGWATALILLTIIVLLLRKAMKLTILRAEI